MKFVRSCFLGLAFFLSTFSFALAGNITNSNDSATLLIDDTDVLFICGGCDVEVSDTLVSGVIWGESLGWVNLQPADGGVENTREGDVTGNAWGATAGWVDFSEVSINPFNGYFEGEAFSQNRGPILFECPGPYCVQTTWRPEGCTDSDATNYSSTATLEDGSCVYADVLGCMDPEALNYDVLATVEDGSCEYDSGGGGSGTDDPVTGCTDPNASNYNPNAEEDDGSCIVCGDGLACGCTDATAENWDPLATVDDGSCVFIDFYGCMDPAADNYDPTATIPYECYYLGCTNPQADNYDSQANLNDNSCIIGGCTDTQALNYNPYATYQPENFCIFSIDGEGCTDPAAINYNSDAIEDSGLCQYYGCTIDFALNYNPSATVDDGSCDYVISGCTDPVATNTHPYANVDDGSCVYDEIPGCTNPDSPLFDPEATVFLPGSCSLLSYSCQDPSALNFDLTAQYHDQDLCLFGVVDEELPNEDEPVIPGLIHNPITDSFVPGFVSEYITSETLLLRLLALALLLASLFQILPLREGNLLLSVFGFYKTKRYWGTVYDSQTKQPLDPVLVTLFDESGQPIDTAITDIDGRYSFVIGPGTYYLSAQKTDYQFPSTKLAGKHYDELYTHLYFGGEVLISSEDEILSLNIPMDPLNFNWNEFAKKKTRVTHFYRPWHRILSVISKTLFILGCILAVWVFTVSPSVISGIILFLYIVTIILRFIGFKYLPRGFVKDPEGFALPFSIVRVYSASLGREVKHAVVGALGHYLILVPNGKYYLTVERKLPDGSYQEVYTSSKFRVRKGFIAKKIHIDTISLTEDEKFEQKFNQ